MSNKRNFLRTASAAVFLTVFALNAARADDVAFFKDVLKPGGHTRSMTAKLADGQACGISGGVITVLMPAFETCMHARGWALDHYGPDPAQPRPRATMVNFTDVKGDATQQPRGGAALQSDTRSRDTGGKDVESASFKACMAAHGWQFTFTQRAPAVPATPAPSTWSNSDSESAASSNNDDLLRMNDDINQGAQDSADAVNAASQATADSDAAVDAQWQLNSILANAPQPPN